MGKTRLPDLSPEELMDLLETARELARTLTVAARDHGYQPVLLPIVAATLIASVASPLNTPLAEVLKDVGRIAELIEQLRAAGARARSDA